MKFAVLGSGSSGNSTILVCGNTRILIDAGLSAKQLCLRLASIGIDPASLSAILLTHEHGDHTRGLRNFLKKHPTPIYATPETAHVVREQNIGEAIWKTFDAGQIFPIDHLSIESFAIQHDAVDPVGFVVANDSHRFGLLSDAGQVTSSVKLRLKNLSALFVEANYDEELLEMDTKRPWSIKQRIASRHGHLSNTQVEELLREISHPDLSQIVFGHLSSDCNCPQKVTTRFQACLLEIGHPHTALHCASQAETTPWFEIAAPFRLI
ncbi:MBL fold metallo-hydrolase [Luteolibacter sp. AS25]|uniref:MBL fold metallo-hydrolase n=1 Tax=Luteolibacter sp. AS25 TaxID=3135776 RepID=UPI00398AC03B